MYKVTAACGINSGNQTHDLGVVCAMIMFVNANEFIVFGIGSPLVEWVKGSVAKSAVSQQNLATL